MLVVYVFTILSLPNVIYPVLDLSIYSISSHNNLSAGGVVERLQINNYNYTYTSGFI